MKRIGHHEDKPDFGSMCVESGRVCMGAKHACGSFDRLIVIYVSKIVEKNGRGDVIMVLNSELHM